MDGAVKMSAPPFHLSLPENCAISYCMIVRRLYKQTTVTDVAFLSFCNQFVALAQGEPKKRRARDRLPASYINFYLANGGAVIPAFGEATDAL